MKTVAAIRHGIAAGSIWLTALLFGSILSFKDRDPRRADRMLVVLIVLLSLLVMFQLWRMDPAIAHRLAPRLL